MTAAQKEGVFSFLTMASRTVCGAPPAAFDTVPAFEDDGDIGLRTEDGGRRKPGVSESPAHPSILQAIEDDAPIGLRTEDGGLRKPEVSESPANPSILNPQSSILQAIEAEIASCTACPLCRTRTRTVSGTGPPNPVVLVVGEAPGRDEDAQGLPFVGRAGQLLDKMLEAISLSRRTNCFIANTIKCRPPENRDPFPGEQDACFHFLRRQIDALRPAAILVVGRIALQRLLGSAMGITRIHGQFFDYTQDGGEPIPLMATFHPSYLLRDPSQKRLAWEDLQKFRARLRELRPGYENAN